MTEHTFTTPEAIELYVELGSGSLTTRAGSTDETRVAITGPRAEDFEVEQRGRTISVIAPRQRFGFGNDQHTVEVTLPTGSDLTGKIGSADTLAEGSYRTVKLKVGSGDVEIETTTGPTVVESGSGDVTCAHVEGDLRVKSGSGDVDLGEVLGTAGISTGSGDVLLGRAVGKAMLKTGSGDLQVQRMETDLQLSTASGDLLVRQALRGRLTVKSASGDMLVGVPDGTPVWTDISTVTGSVSSNLPSTGKPAEGQDHVEVRATTVSGDVRLQRA
ncbi:MAG TPA: DUF4097 family beta strand repeat-containing protein [Marmoricola sp.]|nr:DUF4097 family beta strand repeat-containing protein [Marmoricola sp.]